MVAERKSYYKSGTLKTQSILKLQAQTKAVVYVTWLGLLLESQ